MNVTSRARSPRLSLLLAVAAFACLVACVWSGDSWAPAHQFCTAAGGLWHARGCWNAPAWSKALGVAAVVIGAASVAAWLAPGRRRSGHAGDLPRVTRR